MPAAASTLETLRVKVIKKLYWPRHPITSTSGTGTGVSTLADTILQPASQTEDFVGAWILVTSGAADGGIARVTNVTFSPSSSQMTIAPSITGFATGMTYEVHYRFHPDAVKDKINEILENMRRPMTLVVTDIEDGNMETPAASVATYWAASGAHTVTKTSLASRVYFGEQSLLITGGATGIVSALSPNRPQQYKPSTELLVEALVNPLDSGSTVRMRLFDVTNSAYIADATATSALQGWSVLRFVVETPATCEEVRVDFDVTDGANCCVNYLALVPTRKRLFEFPTTSDGSVVMEWGEDLEQYAFYFPQGEEVTVGTSNNCFEVPETGVRDKWSDLRIWKNQLAKRPFRFELLNPRRELDRAIWVEGYVDFPTLSADTDTTMCPPDILVDLTTADLFDDWAEEDDEEGREKLAQKKRDRANTLRQRLNPRFRQWHQDRGKIIGAFTKTENRWTDTGRFV